MSDSDAVEVNTEGLIDIDELLESLKGKYDQLLITGFDKEGNLCINSSFGSLPFMHWALNRTIFELGLYEKQSMPPQDEETPESIVDTEASKK